MEDNRLLEMAKLLDGETADSKSQISGCNPPHLVGLTANRAGFLRLPAACLRAAAAPIVEEDCRSRPVEISLPHEQVVDKESDSVICFLQRMETWPEAKEYIEARKQRARKNDRWVLLTCGVIAFIVLFVISTGIATIVGWFR